MKVAQWTMPTTIRPRRMEIGADGMIWIGEFNAGKMARLILRLTLKNSRCLARTPPLRVGLMHDGNIWYDSHRWRHGPI